MVADGSNRKTPSNIVWFDLNLSPEESGLLVESKELQCMFYRFLGSFLKERYTNDYFGSLPPMLEDGRPVDLFKLFLVVREKGGCDSVSKTGMWDLVAEESRLGLKSATSVKLLYTKYLGALERCLERVVRSKGARRESNDTGLDLGLHLMELGPELEEVLFDFKIDKEMEVNMVVELDKVEKCASDEEVMDIDSTIEAVKAHHDNVESEELVPELDEEKSSIDVSDETPSYYGKSVSNSSNEKLCNDEGVKSAAMEEPHVEVNKLIGVDDVTLDPFVSKENISNCKRKRDSAYGMLNWVTKISKDPCNPTIGSLPERFKWNSYGSEALWKQVLLFREATFLRRHVNSNAEQPTWKKNQKMHPCMYDDHIGYAYKLRERSGCTKKALSHRKKSKTKGSSRASSTTQSDLDGSMELTDKQLYEICDFSGASWFGCDYDKKVPIGPKFQAEVQEWTGITHESDSKWCGTRIWPLEKKGHGFLVERDPIGRGRQESCGCEIPGSAQCIRFHISEKKSKVKLELGLAFHHWKFDKMGEQVAASWKGEEEAKFMSTVKLNPPHQCFWNLIYKNFPYKSREDLVCYYYNVFLLRRRAYQNKNTPNNIDSDDEESQPGLITNGFVNGAVKSSSSIFCTPKKQHKKFR